jgi:iron complex outermembrane receptor protein
VEYEITATPVRGLTLSAIGAYNDFKQTGPAFIGEPVLRPKFTANLGAEYEVPVGDMRFSVGGDANYRSKVLMATGFPFSEDPAINPDGAALNDVIKQPGLWKLNARVSLKDVPLGPTKGRLTLWGRNLTNKQPVVFAGNVGTHVSGVFDDPVTYGVDLTVEF